MNFFNEFESKFTLPKNCITSFLSFGDGIFLMASIFDGIGLIVLFPISCPMNFTLSIMYNDFQVQV